MNKLMIHKEYNQVLNLFEMQLPFFIEERVTKTNVLNKSILPYDQTSLVLEALLCLVINFFQLDYYYEYKVYFDLEFPRLI